MATKDISDLQCCIAAMPSERYERTGEKLMKLTGQPEKVCERALERAIRRGYLDCGLGAWWAFLVEPGEELLRANGRPV